MSKKHRKIAYIASVADSKNTQAIKSASSIMLIGDAVLGIYTKWPEDAPNDKGLDDKYQVQTPRIANGFINALSNKHLDNLHLYLENDILNELKVASVRPSKVHFAADSILRFIKLMCIGRSGVIACLSNMKLTGSNNDGVLVEEYKFDNGALIGFTEKRYDRSIFSVELSKSVKDSLKTVPGEHKQVLVCGPLAHLGVESLKELNVADKTDAIFKGVSGLVSSRFSYEGTKKEPLVRYIAILAGSIACAAVMITNGKSNLAAAHKEYHQNVAGFEHLYSKGRAPIDLLEKRTSFLESLDRQRKTSYRLPEIISAIGKAKIALPDINLTTEQVSYNAHNLGETASGESDYMVVLRFDKKPSQSAEEEMAQWQNVFAQFSGGMKGKASVNHSPTTLQITADKSVFLMTINGMFEVQK
jgi:hypothetical protein